MQIVGTFFRLIWVDRGDEDLYINTKIQHHKTLIIENLSELQQPH